MYGNGMRRLALAVAAISLAACGASAQLTTPTERRRPGAQQNQLGATPRKRDAIFTRNPDPGAQWFGNAGLGLFLHWGLSSVEGKGDLSWSMIADTPWDSGRNKMTPNQYFAMAKRFNPAHYDPDKWLKAAKAAGFRYAVLTTRHHEGFALWPSEYGDFSTRNYMGGRDLVKPFVEACRRNGLKVGLYYSPPDWYYNRSRMSFRYSGAQKLNPALPDLGLDHQPTILPTMSDFERQKWDEGYRAYVRGQVEELLTRYGKIDLLWFDGGPNVISIDEIREMQPSIVVNPRMHGYGDFRTPEVNFPDKRPEGWWELCTMWNSGGWGYTLPVSYRTTASVLTEFVKVRAWGGNYPINMAPNGDGELPDLAYQRMAELSQWMKANADSVFDTEPDGWPQDCNVPVTVSGSTYYLHVTPDVHGPVELRNVPHPTEVKMFATGRLLAYTWFDDTLHVELPDDARTDLDDVVIVKTDGR